MTLWIGAEGLRCVDTHTYIRMYIHMYISCRAPAPAYITCVSMHHLQLGCGYYVPFSISYWWYIHAYVHMYVRTYVCTYIYILHLLSRHLPCVYVGGLPPWPALQDPSSSAEERHSPTQRVSWISPTSQAVTVVITGVVHACMYARKCEEAHTCTVLLMYIRTYIVCSSLMYRFCGLWLHTCASEWVSGQVAIICETSQDVFV